MALSIFRLEREPEIWPVFARVKDIRVARWVINAHRTSTLTTAGADRALSRAWSVLLHRDQLKLGSLKTLAGGWT